MAVVKMVHHPEGYAAIAHRASLAGEAIAGDVLDDARADAPVRTGALVASMKLVRTGPFDWKVTVGGPGLDYWYIMEYGTDKKNYIIKPRLKRALWWFGMEHPVAQVTHPGVEPRPFMRPAVYKKRAVYFPPKGGMAVVVDA